MGKSDIICLKAKTVKFQKSPKLFISDKIVVHFVIFRLYLFWFKGIYSCDRGQTQSVFQGKINSQV